MRQKKTGERTGDLISHCNTSCPHILQQRSWRLENINPPQPHFQITVSRTKVIMRRKLYLQKKPFNPVFTWPPLMKIPEFFNLPLETGRLCMLALNSQHSQHRGFPGTERNREECRNNKSTYWPGRPLLQVRRRRREAAWKPRLKYFRK